MLYLSRFDFTLKYIPGVRIGKVDRLSRRPDLKVRAENDNENQKLIKEKWIQEMIEVVVEKLEAKLVEKIKWAREKNKKVVKVVEEIKKAGVKALKDDEWEIVGDLVLKKEKVYVLKDENLRFGHTMMYK